MKKWLTILTVSLFTGVVGAAAPEGWTTDINAALKTAKAENKKVLLLFTGSDWCGYCIRLKNDVFSRDIFKRLAEQHFVPVYFDFPHRSMIAADQMKIQQQWSEKFGVEGYPTVIILDPDGKKIGGIGGYRPRAAYIRMLQRFVR